MVCVALWTMSNPLAWVWWPQRELPDQFEIVSRDSNALQLQLSHSRREDKHVGRIRKGKVHCDCRLFRVHCSLDRFGTEFTGKVLCLICAARADSIHHATPPQGWTQTKLYKQLAKPNSEDEEKKCCQHNRILSISVTWRGDQVGTTTSAIQQPHSNNLPEHACDTLRGRTAKHSG